MPDPNRLLGWIDEIVESATRIGSRVSKISDWEAFFDSEDGLETFDSICMLLIVIGEQCRKIVDSAPNLVDHNPQIHWRGWISLRNIVSHDYRHLDAELVFKTATEEIPELIDHLKRLQGELLAPAD
jgi:uncharacterized protein with HEPN domain